MALLCLSCVFQMYPSVSSVLSRLSTTTTVQTTQDTVIGLLVSALRGPGDAAAAVARPSADIMAPAHMLLILGNDSVEVRHSLHAKGVPSVALGMLEAWRAQVDSQAGSHLSPTPKYEIAVLALNQLL